MRHTSVADGNARPHAALVWANDVGTQKAVIWAVAHDSDGCDGRAIALDHPAPGCGADDQVGNHSWGPLSTLEIACAFFAPSGDSLYMVIGKPRQRHV